MSKKRSYGEGKTIRLPTLITEQIQTLLVEIVENTGISRNEMVNLALLDVLLDESKFLRCPKCECRLEYKPRVSVMGIGQYDCKCGTKVWWDTEEDKIIKTA